MNLSTYLLFPIIYATLGTNPNVTTNIDIHDNKVEINVEAHIKEGTKRKTDQGNIDIKFKNRTKKPDLIVLRKILGLFPREDNIQNDSSSSDSSNSDESDSNSESIKDNNPSLNNTESQTKEKNDAKSQKKVKLISRMENINSEMHKIAMERLEHLLNMLKSNETKTKKEGEGSSKKEESEKPNEAKNEEPMPEKTSETEIEMPQLTKPFINPQGNAIETTDPINLNESENAEVKGKDIPIEIRQIEVVEKEEDAFAKKKNSSVANQDVVEIEDEAASVQKEGIVEVKGEQIPNNAENVDERKEEGINEKKEGIIDDGDNAKVKSCEVEDGGVKEGVISNDNKDTSTENVETQEKTIESEPVVGF